MTKTYIAFSLLCCSTLAHTAGASKTSINSIESGLQSVTLTKSSLAIHTFFSNPDISELSIERQSACLGSAPTIKDFEKFNFQTFNKDLVYLYSFVGPQPKVGEEIRKRINSIYPNHFGTSCLAQMMKHEPEAMRLPIVKRALKDPNNDPTYEPILKKYFLENQEWWRSNIKEEVYDAFLKHYETKS